MSQFTLACLIFEKNLRHGKYYVQLNSRQQGLLYMRFELQRGACDI